MRSRCFAIDTTVNVITIARIHGMLNQFVIVTGYAKRGLTHVNQKYYFNSIYLKNDQSCLHVFLHKSIAIQGNSLCLLYTGQLAEIAYHFRQFFTGIASITSTPIGWGRMGSHKVMGKGYIFNKNSQMTFIGVIITSTCHIKSLNPWTNSSASCVVIHSWLSACQGKITSFEGHLSPCGYQTGLRKRLE